MEVQKILHIFVVMKVLCMIRVSTETQRLEDQHNEMVKFCTDEGYDEIVFVEDKGASAIKLNDQYRLMISQVQEEIEKDPSIRCFAVWELSRAFRNELVFQQVKQFLVERKVQFMVKTPYLKLLNPDGTVNPGMEIAVTLMATLAQQEMSLKKERFKRAKDAMRKQGRFIGGRCTKFGYKVGEGGYIVIDEENAPLVRLIFDLYSTGKYSVRTLYEELKDRGYDINYHLVNRMVADRTYVESPYPQMISEDLWKKCETVRKKNFISIPKGHRNCFGSGIFKCSVCGRSMLADGDQYRCRSHKKYSAPPHCSNYLTIRIENLDGLLWFVTTQEETKYRFRTDSERRGEMEKEIEVMRQKVETARKNLSSLSEKRSRINELYEEGYITREQMKIRQNKTLSDEKIYNDTILELEEKIEGVLTLLRANENEVPSPEFMKDVYLGVLRESEIKEMDKMVKKHIRTVTATATEFNGRKSAQVITIETVCSGEKKFIYVARKYQGHYFFTMDGKALRSIRKIVREPLGELNPRAFKKICYI